MKITKYLLTTALLLTFSSVAIAHPGDHSGEGERAGRKKGKSTERKVEKLTERLGLNQDQQTTVFNAFENAKQACQASGETRRERRECMKGQRDNVNASINSVLTENQQAAFETFKAERKSKHLERRSRRGNR